METKPPVRICARVGCRKRLVRRATEGPKAWAKKQFCSTACATRCSRWALKGRGERREEI